MEEAQRAKLYEYRSNSNLVLNLERKPRENLPSGEVESLVGKVSIKDMKDNFGSRVTYDRPVELEERLQKAKKRRDDLGYMDDWKPKVRKPLSETNAHVLVAQIGSSYQPKSRDTRKAYEILLDFISHEIGEAVSQDILRSAAEEVLSILKEENYKDKEKQDHITNLFRLKTPFTSQRFANLVNIGKNITDFTTDEKDSSNVPNAQSYEEIPIDEGVSVVFKEEEEQASDVDEIFEDDNEEEEDKIDEDLTLESKIKDYDDDALGVDEGDQGIDVKLIDAFWLQRELSKYYLDALVSQKMANDVYNILSDEKIDNRTCENHLVFLLEHDKFQFVKKLLINRLKIVYCMRLAHSSSEEKTKIEEEMMNDPKLRGIYEALTKTTHTASDKSRNIEKKLLREARTLKSGHETQPGSSHTQTTRPGISQTLDLSSLIFQQGNHFMSNQDCQIPEGSWRVEKKGYQEVHVPALAPRDNTQIKTIYKHELPTWIQPCFTSNDVKDNVDKLNPVQSSTYNIAFLSPHNMLVCAPTGSGKTNVALLTILREIGLHRNILNDKDDDSISIRLDEFKIIYIAPMKSLVREVVMKFSEKLKPYGINVEELTGDVSMTKQQISHTQMIVTTPEKWDIITRKSPDKSLMNCVRLIIIDEIHLLHDDRGPVLENIVVRTLRHIESTAEMIRMVALSATLPNYEDVAQFLRVDPSKGLFYFDNSFRPVPLQQQYIGITEKKPFKRMQLMNDICYEKLIEQLSSHHQVLVFVHTRKDTAATAKVIRDMAQERDTINLFLTDDRSHTILEQEKESVKSADLQDVMPYGIGIHNAGMTREDRSLVEDLFWHGHLQVLFSTATLAWGVNLPARTVIIKGTQVYSPDKGSWVELSPQDMLQMIGRAGRPQFDNFGEGIIITQHSELYYYLSLLNQQLPIESQFIHRLVDSLNAEIVLGTIHSLSEAVDWLSYTYLYIRMLKKPGIYGISEGMITSDPELSAQRLDLIKTSAYHLEQTNLIKFDPKSESFLSTDFGVIASHYYITYSSISTYNQHLKPYLSDIELFRIFSLSEEFKYMRVREEEKLEMAKLLDRVPIPIKENLDEASAKVNVLLQSYISRLPLDGYALQADMVFIEQSAGRILRSLFMMALKRRWSNICFKLLNMCLMVDHRMWSTQCPLRQFRGMPLAIIKRIEKKDFPWERFFDLKPQEIGQFIGFQKHGKLIHKLVHQLPRLSLSGQLLPITRSVMRVEITLQADFIFDEKIHGNNEPFWIVVEDSDGESILHTEFFIMKKQYVDFEHTVSFYIPLKTPLPPQYFVRVVSDRWIQTPNVLPLSFRNLLLPEKFPPPTELLDLAPLLTKSLNMGDIFDNFFPSQQINTFNAIQTQSFSSVYETNDNVLICAPPGSGKTVIAQLAIIKALRDNPQSHIIMVAPVDELIQIHYQTFSRLFSPLGISVNTLTGESSTDLVILSSSSIVLSTVTQWDMLSRRWKTRKILQSIDLFIVDELHLLGGQNGPTLEIIVSRMRYIGVQVHPVRMIALSASISNAIDVGEWIGCNLRNIFNFHPNVRPVPLSINIQTFDNYNYDNRQESMITPVYQTITNIADSKPVMVFVPSRRYARQLSCELVTHVLTSENSSRWLHLPREEIENEISTLSQKSLVHVLSHGIGYIHEGLTMVERECVLRLFDCGVIQILVSTANLCYSLTSTCYLTIIAGTQRYVGSEHRYVDYSLTEMIQMMGRSSRPQEDDHSHCSIFCYTPQKFFFQKFLFEPFPIESHLDHYLADHLNAEISTKTIDNLQDSVDYITWSFLYRRLSQNPHYYNLAGNSHQLISQYLSELIEETISTLQQSKCVELDEEDLSPLNLGMIASFYYINHSTIELFSSNLQNNNNLSGILEILSNASEMDSIPIRLYEEQALQNLSQTLRFINPEVNFNDPHTKCNLLLQSHFSRLPLTSDVQLDQQKILPEALRLLKSMVDVISSNRWLHPALICMELSQMIVQGLWDDMSVLYQIPYFDSKLVEKCSEIKVNDIFDFINLDNTKLNKLLKDLPNSQKKKIQQFCLHYPNIEVEYSLLSSSVYPEETVSLSVIIKQLDEDPQLKVSSLYYPFDKTENWWLVIGDQKENILYAIKRTVINQPTMKLQLDFDAPNSGVYNLSLYLMSDSYMGCDQEYNLELVVNEEKMEVE